MKKFVFSLLAIGMMSFSASAAEGTVGKKIEPAKKETVSKKKQKAVKKAALKNEEIKTVVCEVSVGGVMHYGTYSCFFCWGGSANGCKAALLDQIAD
jgi:hypothetical protein